MVGYILLSPFYKNKKKLENICYLSKIETDNN